MNSGWENWAISIATFLPLVGALVIAFTPRERDRLVRSLGVLITAAALVAGVVMALGFDYGAGHGLQFEVNARWIPVIGARYHVGIDGISLPLYLLTLALSSLCTFDIVELQQFAAAGGFAKAFQLVAFVGVFLGFAIKVPMWPFHTWLPDAHTEAPTVGSVLLAGILLKMGTYGFIRIALPILPDAARTWAPAIAILAVIAIVYASLACLAQRDLKRLIAFSSVGHMGFVMLGIATLTPVGINAAIFGMVAHGLVTGMLFFEVGSIYDRYHTRQIADIGGG